MLEVVLHGRISRTAVEFGGRQPREKGMRMIGLLSAGIMFAAGAAMAQGPEQGQPVGTMSELMVSVVYPPVNELLLVMHRGGPSHDKEWAAAQRNNACITCHKHYRPNVHPGLK